MKTRKFAINSIINLIIALALASVFSSIMMVFLNLILLTAMDIWLFKYYNEDGN